MSDMQVKLQSAFRVIIAKNEEIEQLRVALTEIRDLARTGLKPDVYPSNEEWYWGRLNTIARTANQAVEKANEVKHE